jgi:hypothetical protein
MLILFKISISWRHFRKISVRNSGSVLKGLDGGRDREGDQPGGFWTRICVPSKSAGRRGNERMIYLCIFKRRILSVALRPRKASVEANFLRAVFVF